MTSPRDKILNILVEKKKSLLESFLEKSRELAIARSEPERNRLFQSRVQLMRYLRKNDAAITQRERETGLNSRESENEMFRSMAPILETILENDAVAVKSLEESRRHLESEKEGLVKETKASGYLMPAGVTRKLNSA